MWTAAAMLPPTVFGFTEDMGAAWILSLSVTATLGGALWLFTPQHVSINRREGIVVVGLGWLSVVAAGSLPFIFTGVAPTAAGAIFESVSGFTTTGATIFPVIEDLPRSILLWRSISHWLGGMGIIVLGVAILPLIGMGGAQLFRAEVPGIATDRLKPRVATTARLLWGVYAALTAVLGILYLALGMSLFDAVNHAMSALATGGFSTKTASLGSFKPAIQWVTIVFMLAAGTNFTLHYRFLTGRWNSFFRDAEWRWYAGIALGAAIAVFVALGLSTETWVFRDAAFNVVAILSTTGFATADFGTWPDFTQVLLLSLMFVGAMGGSTGGGFKMARAVVVLKHAASEVRKVLHPRALFVPGKRAGLPGAVRGYTWNRLTAHCCSGQRLGDIAQCGSGCDVQHRTGSGRCRAGIKLRTPRCFSPPHSLRTHAARKARVLHPVGVGDSGHVGPVGGR
jgi:trk system potassium uptake protein TrkH